MDFADCLLWTVGSYASGNGASLPLILHSSGDGTWKKDLFQPDSGIAFHGAVRAVWAVSRSDVYVSAGPALGIESSGPFYGVWGSRYGDVYIVGQDGVILHKRGEQRERKDCLLHPERALRTVATTRAALPKGSTGSA